MFFKEENMYFGAGGVWWVTAAIQLFGTQDMLFALVSFLLGLVFFALGLKKATELKEPAAAGTIASGTEIIAVANTLVDEPVAAEYSTGYVTVRFKSGHVVTFPIQGNPRLESATEAELNAITLSPFGIHWTALDEDLSFEGIMRGDYGQR